jgi:hypothetical protein
MGSAVTDKQQVLALIKANQLAVQSLGVAKLGLFGSLTYAGRTVRGTRGVW